MRDLLTAAILACALLAGCLDDGPAPVDEGPDLPGDATTDPWQPAVGNARLYLHSDGQRTWMDTDPAATETALGGTWSLTQDEPWHRFPLEPTTRRDIALEGDVQVDVEAQAQFLLLEDTEVRVRLVVDGQPAAETVAEGGRASLPAPETVPEGTPVAIEVCVCPTPTSLFYSYVLFTDGSSLATLPVTSPVYVGGGNGTQGDVATGQTEDGRWYARQGVEYVGGLQGATEVEASFAAGNGAIEVDVQESGFAIMVAKEGLGDTEQEARDNLAAIMVAHEARLAGDTMGLATIVTTADGSWQDRRAAIQAAIEPVPLASLDADTTNGAVMVFGHSGGDWALTTTNGAIEARGDADTLEARTTNGAVHAEGTVRDLDVATTNARITLGLEAGASGTWTASTANGQISLTAPEDASRGYDIEGHTTNGIVEFAFAQTQPVGEQSDTHRHERTQGFDGRDVQTTVRLETTNGSITAGP